MAGRGRGKPCKAKIPDAQGAKSKTRLEEIKQVHLGRCPGEEKENEIGKEQRPCGGKAKPRVKFAEETPETQLERAEELKKTPKTRKVPEKTTKAKTCADEAKLIEEAIERAIKMPPETPKEGTNAKTCAARTKPTEQSAEDTAKESPETRNGKKRCGGAKLTEQFAEKIQTQPETPTRTTKTCGGKVKAGVQLPEVMTKMKPDIPNYTTKDSTPKAEACGGGKAKPRVKFAEKTPELETPKDNAAVDSVLNTTLKNLKIKRDDRSNASRVVNEIIDNIIKHLRQNTQCFQAVEEPLRTGSYYENLKISNPDEFDVMVPIPVERVDVKPFGDDGAFYSVALKRGGGPLKKFQENDILSASEMLQEFREEVKKCVKNYEQWKLTRKKQGCPAVTMTTEVNSVTISLDVVLCLMVKSSWPSFTEEGLRVQGWLGAKVRRDYRLKHYYLVPKYEGRGNVENDGVLAKDSWRVSFSHVEKAILMNHGSKKTCCEREGDSCCRKDCLKLLKHLLSLLKENDSSFDKFCSYHAKTTLFHACCSRTQDSDWEASDLSRCFHLLLQDFEGHLEKGELPNFFIPSQNLLSGPGKKKCKTLADRIKEERLSGFPMFRQQLYNPH